MSNASLALLHTTACLSGSKDQNVWELQLLWNENMLSVLNKCWLEQVKLKVMWNTDIIFKHGYLMKDQ